MSARTSFQIKEAKSHIEVTLEPEVIDADWSMIEEFGAEVVAKIQDRKKPACLINLSPLDYMGSALVALIVRIWKVVKAEQGRMIVVCPNPVVSQVISLAGLDKVWRVVPTLPIALKELGAPVPSVVVASKTQAGEPLQAPQGNTWNVLWPILGVIVVIAVITILVLKTLSETP